MQITVIANHPIVTTIVLNAGVFLDNEPDTIYLSNPLDKAIPIAFFKPEPIDLTFNGGAVESLELAPHSLVRLQVNGGDITADKVVEGSVTPVSFVDPGVLSAANWWNFLVDNSLSQKGFGYKKMKALYASELKRIQSLLV
jgi:hypothetical protein